MVFRSLKSIDINVRPVRHFLENRVRAHVFLCVLSANGVLVKVFNGNTSDLASLRSVIEDIKTTHKLDKLIVIGGI